MLWYLGNHSIWDKFTKRKPPAAIDGRIVVHAPNHLGDNVMAIPFVMALLQGYADITIISRSEYSVIWKTLNTRLKVISYDGWNRQETRRLKKLLKELKFDVAFLLATGMEVSWLYFTAGIRHRLGYDYWGRGFLLTARINSFHQPTSEQLVRQHFSDNIMQLLALLPLLPQKKQLPVQQMKLPWLKNGSVKAAKEKVILGLALGGNTPDKMPTLNFWQSIVELSKEELDPDEIYLLGSASQREIGEQLSSQNDRLNNLCGETSVESLMLLLAECDVVISPDSGIAHLASALGLPTLAFFTSGSPVWTRPGGGPVAVVESTAVCSPCFNMTRCKHAYQCLEKLELNSFLTGLQVLCESAKPLRISAAR